jgi:glyoxylate reductase
MPKVFVTREIPEEGINLLKEKGYDVEVSDFDGVLPREQLLEKVRGADAVLPLLTDKVDAEFFEAAGPQLKIVANYAVGYDNIDVEEAKKRGIITTNTPDVLTEAVAEHALALMMAIARRIVESDKFMREGKYAGWAPMLLMGREFAGKTLGLVGLGRIGAKVAEMMKNAFRMNIVYFDVRRNEALEKELGLVYADLEAVLGQSDFISVHVPLLPSTKHLISGGQLKKMKPTAYLVNTSRGPVLDENALVEALKNNVIGGAALDVFEEEPKMAPGLAELDNVIVTPHIASATEEARGAMSELAAKNIIEVLEGREAITPIK